MTHLVKDFQLKSRDFLRAGEVSIQVQGLLKKIGFEADLIRRVSICAYESEMNVVMHGGDGTLTLAVNAYAIQVEVKDGGKGIEDIELALREGYSTASAEDREMGFGAGMGLPNIKRNSDALEIVSRKGEGTCLRMLFHVTRKDE